jgi:hypothetical protein
MLITILIANQIHELVSSKDSWKVGLRLVNGCTTFAAN